MIWIDYSPANLIPQLNKSFLLQNYPETHPYNYLIYDWLWLFKGSYLKAKLCLWKVNISVKKNDTILTRSKTQRNQCNICIIIYIFFSVLLEDHKLALFFPLKIIQALCWSFVNLYSFRLNFNFPLGCFFSIKLLRDYNYFMSKVQ